MERYQTEPYLAIVDADKIHDYVFSPHELKLIRGGSAIQSLLNGSLEKLQDFGPGNVNSRFEIAESPTLGSDPSLRWEAISADGGTTLVLFRSKADAQRYCSNAEDLFHEHTRAATVTSAVVAWESDFNATLKQARYRLESRKAGRSEHNFTGGGPYWKTCDRCGLNPAESRGKTVDGEDVFPCAACRLRRRSSEKSPYLEEVFAGLKPVRDFENLGGLSSPRNYLAMVYIDIDRLGRYLDLHATSAEKYRSLSRNIRETVRNGVFNGCRVLCDGLEKDDSARFEILLIGGDDAIVMLPAHMVFRFLEQFQASFTIGDLSYSAGVVWAHQQFPISQFLARAEDLLRSAKAEPGNRVDYLVVSEAMARDMDRRDSPHTKKPYSMADFLALEKTLNAWKEAGVPATKARSLYSIAYETEHQATLDYFFLLSRLSTEHQRLFRKQFPEGIWSPGQPKRTSAADLIELWDFVKA